VRGVKEHVAGLWS